MSAQTRVDTPVSIGGRAPRGAWWAAFRLQRSTLLIGLGVLAVMAGLLLWHRSLVLSLYASNGIGAATPCPAGNGRTQLMSEECVSLRRLQSDLAAPWQVLRTIWPVVPTVIGAASGAALFSREFERRSQVFALTQSVSSLRWFLTKVTIGLVPLLAASIGVGFLFELTANAYGAASWTPVEEPLFPAFGFVPGAVLLAAFAVGVAVSTVLRSSLSAVLASVVAALGLLGVLVFGYLYLPAAERYTAPVSAEFQLPVPERAAYIHSGFLDSSGQELTVSFDCVSSAGGVTSSAATRECFAGQGAVEQFVDHLPLSARAELTWTVAGIAAGLSALFLAAGYALLRRKVQ